MYVRIEIVLHVIVKYTLNEQPQKVIHIYFVLLTVDGATLGMVYDANFGYEEVNSLQTFWNSIKRSIVENAEVHI